MLNTELDSSSSSLNNSWLYICSLTDELEKSKKSCSEINSQLSDIVTRNLKLKDTYKKAQEANSILENQLKSFSKLLDSSRSKVCSLSEELENTKISNFALDIKFENMVSENFKLSETVKKLRCDLHNTCEENISFKNELDTHSNMLNDAQLDVK
ncbi:hypothetical protein HK096_005588, partial [Nowakowskiella sp. JEL0078]